MLNSESDKRGIFSDFNPSFKLKELISRFLGARCELSNRVNQLSNSEYVAAATEMLNTNAQEQIALQELAASVGLAAPEILLILNGR